MSCQSLRGGVSLVVARWTLDVVASLLPAEAVATIRLDLDLRVLSFSAALTLGTGLLFGLFPALHSTRPDLMASLKGQAGLATAVALGRLAKSLLYQLQGSDPLVFAGSAVALAFVALVAGIIPAHRASQVDPMQALRFE